MEDIKKIFEEELDEVTTQDLALVDGADFELTGGNCGVGCIIKD